MAGLAGFEPAPHIVVVGGCRSIVPKHLNFKVFLGVYVGQLRGTLTQFHRILFFPHLR